MSNGGYRSPNQASGKERRMLNLLRNALALILGIVLGGGVNMAIIILGPTLNEPERDRSFLLPT